MYGSHLQASQSFHWLSFKKRCFFLVEEGWLSKPWPPYTNLCNPIKQLPRSTTRLSQLFGVSTLKAYVCYLLRDCQGDLKALSPSLPWSTTCSPQSFHYNIKLTWGFETEQDPMVLASHVLGWPFVEKNFCQQVSLIREVRTWRRKWKQSKETK